MKRLMKIVAALLSGMLVVPACYANAGCGSVDAGAGQVKCADEAGDPAGQASSLPKEAQEQVNELAVKMRYFKAIGFHKQSGAARDQIVEIYEQNGLPVPDEYKE